MRCGRQWAVDTVAVCGLACEWHGRHPDRLPRSWRAQGRGRWGPRAGRGQPRVLSRASWQELGDFPRGEGGLGDLFSCHVWGRLNPSGWGRAGSSLLGAASWEQLSLCLDTGSRRDSSCLPGSSRVSPASETTWLGDLEVTSADPARGSHTQPPSEATLGTREF